MILVKFLWRLFSQIASHLLYIWAEWLLVVDTKDKKSYVDPIFLLSHFLNLAWDSWQERLYCFLKIFQNILSIVCGYFLFDNKSSLFVTSSSFLWSRFAIEIIKFWMTKSQVIINIVYKNSIKSFSYSI